MEAEGISFEMLFDTLASFRDLRVHVVGDTIVDSYTYCTLIGGNAKTPTFSVKYQRQVDFSGGAAVVSKHIRAAGAQVHFSTVMGKDELKQFVLDDLNREGIECQVSLDPTRPTTQKNVYIASEYRMLKVDKVDNRPVSEKVLEDLKSSLVSGTADAFVFSDFRHGIFNRETIPELTQCLPQGALRIADSQVASRWGNILEFEQFDLITPNESDVRVSVGDQESVVRPLALDLYKSCLLYTSDAADE